MLLDLVALDNHFIHRLDHFGLVQLQLVDFELGDLIFFPQRVFGRVPEIRRVPARVVIELAQKLVPVALLAVLFLELIDAPRLTSSIGRTRHEPERTVGFDEP